MKRPLLSSLAGGLAFMIAASAQTAHSQDALPPLVRAAIAEAKGDCRLSEVSLKKGFLSKKDVNDDGILDYILDYSHLECSGNPNGFCGSAGCLTEIFVSIKDGMFVKAFSDNVRSYSFRKINGKTAMILSLHGSSCGRIGSQACDATLYWNGTKFSSQQDGSKESSSVDASAGAGDVVKAIIKLDTGSWGVLFAQKPTGLMKRYFTAGFNKSWVKALSHNAEGPVMDGDPITGMQSVSAVALSSIESSVTASTATVTAYVVVTAEGKKTPQTIIFTLKREGGTWKVDDIKDQNMPSIRSYFRKSYGA